MQTTLRLRKLGLMTVLTSFALVAYVLVVSVAPQPTVNNTDVVSDRVSNVMGGGVNDVVITLEGDDRIYYINRGQERGVTLNRLAQQLEGEQIELHVARVMWSLSTPPAV
ncbi:MULTISPECIES: hypothetical protein [Cyanophyceae]|uniref:hypothetical protein n=1 Tax=Cyanophyceae TaxID=3028117 RepID=UPI0016895EE3|nr:MULTISPECIES: hypothetical protein [Cyanophyceae]MBD1915107.1 hypothetical protein [Phormidium sp. FACHB-77]MBD2029775.1 hypothetical protein [Phormidium sp. FACHB-322]MBD2050467.1 hypothetical protein [Leptolyngbya sp. FACHB-60]